MIIPLTVILTTDRITVYVRTRHFCSHIFPLQVCRGHSDSRDAASPDPKHTTAAARAALTARALHMYARDYYGAHNSVVWRKICYILGGPERTGLVGWSPRTPTTIQVRVHTTCMRDDNHNTCHRLLHAICGRRRGRRHRG